MPEQAVLDRLDELEQKMDTLIKLEKGGNQPSSNYKVQKKNGAPTDMAVSIMKEARKGGKYDGVPAGMVENLIEEKVGKEPSRTTTLKVMQKIGKKFSNYKHKSGSGGEASELYHQP